MFIRLVSGYMDLTFFRSTSSQASAHISPWSYPRVCCHYNDEGKFVGKCQDQRLVLMK